MHALLLALVARGGRTQVAGQSAAGPIRPTIRFASTPSRPTRAAGASRPHSRGFRAARRRRACRRSRRSASSRPAPPTRGSLAIFLDDYHVSPSSAARVQRRAPSIRRSRAGPERSAHDPAPARFAADDSASPATARRCIARSTRSKDAAATMRRGARSNATSWPTSGGAPTSSGRRPPGPRSTRWPCTSRICGPGRKTMLLVSEQADPMLRRRGLESAADARSSVIAPANRSNVSIYVLDPLDVGLRAASGDEGPNLLRVLADDTDGALIGPSPDAAAPNGAANAGIEAGLQRCGRCVRVLPVDVPLAPETPTGCSIPLTSK